MAKKNYKNYKKKSSIKQKQFNDASKRNSKDNKNVNTPFKCPKCNITFTLLKNFIRHNKEKHEKKNFKRCPYCHKDVSRYKEHLQRCQKCIYNNIVSLFENFDDNISECDKKEHFSKSLFFEISSYKAFEVKIGEGTFGNVFYGINLENSIPFAVKIFKNKKYNDSSFRREINNIELFRNQKFFTKIYYSEFSDKNKIIVQTLLGPNLKTLTDLCGGKLPLYTILSIGIELLKRIEIIHSLGIIHGDIKPSNILYGNFTANNTIEKDSLYIIDYGLSKKFLTCKNRHIKYSMEKKISGTYEYCSHHALNFEKISRRDDIESLFYTLIKLYRGELPWTKYAKEYTGETKIEKIRECNFNCEPKLLLEGMPELFEFIYKNILMLDFDEKPPYDIYITLFQKEKLKILKKKNISKYKFIWVDIIKEILSQKNKCNHFLEMEIRKSFFSLEKEVLEKYFEDIQKENIYSIFDL